MLFVLLVHAKFFTCTGVAAHLRVAAINPKSDIFRREFTK